MQAFNGPSSSPTPPPPFSPSSPSSFFFLLLFLLLQKNKISKNQICCINFQTHSSVLCVPIFYAISRSVKNVLKKEFDDKANFIANNPFFKNWAPKYKKQLAMALQIEVFPYDSIITKQGDPVAAIYFILK